MGIVVFVVIGGAGLALLLLILVLDDLVAFGDGGVCGTSLGAVTSTVVPNRAGEVSPDRPRELEHEPLAEALKAHGQAAIAQEVILRLPESVRATAKTSDAAVATRPAGGALSHVDITLRVT